MTDIDRRTLLRGATLGAAGFAARALARPDPAAAPGPAPAEEPPGWAAVRESFSLDRSRLQFASFFFVSHPRPVREAIERYRKLLDEDPYGMLERHCFGKPEDNLYDAVKRAAAGYLGGRPEEIALTQSTTMGLALLYGGLTLGKGQEILTTTHDHYVHHEAIRFAAERSGASVRKISLFETFEDLPALTEDALVARVKAAIKPATRVIGLTWVHSQTGLKLPLRAIAAAVRDVNAHRAERDRALLFIDGVHGFGFEDESAAATGIDAFAAGTHKWLLGPRGTGLVWAKSEVWARLRPSIPTFDSERAFVAWLDGKPAKGPADASLFTPGGFHAYEHEWAMTDAFAFHARLGRARVAARLQALNAQLKEGLAAMPNVKLFTPRSAALSSGLVGFDLGTLKAGEGEKRLLAKGLIGAASPYPRSVLRLSATLVNDEAEVDRALAVVRALAS